MRKKYSLYLSGVVLLFLSACSEKNEESVKSDDFCIPDSLMANITLDTVKNESVNSLIHLSGKITVNDDNQVQVFPMAAGHVTEVKVSLGDFVEKGQTLAIVRSTDMASITSDYKSAEAELAIAKKNLEVVTDMQKSGVNSQKDVMSAQSDLDKAQAQFNKSSEILKIFGGSGNGSEYLIKAPISGFVVDKNISSGMELRPDDANMIFTISDLKEVWATANVYESDISHLKQGDRAEVTTLSYPGRKFEGKIEKIANVVNPETNVLSVKVRLINTDYALKPGMFASIDIVIPEGEQLLSVPASAVLYDENQTYVVQFRKRCDVTLQPVTVFKSAEDKVFLTDDSLKANDVVVDKNALFIMTAIKKR